MKLNPERKLTLRACAGLRLIALLTLVAFVSTSFGTRPAYAQSPSATEKVLKFSLPSEGVTVPSELGQIQTYFAGEKGRPLVIFIQDAHAILDAQKHIQKLIDYFRTTYGIHLVAVEGSEGRFDATLYRDFPDPELRTKILNRYLERGELSAAEMVSIADKESAFYGIEDWKLYEENYVAYLHAMRNFGAITKNLDFEEKDLTLALRGASNQDFIAYWRAWKKLRAQSSNLIDFLNVLTELVAKHPALSAELAKYPELKVLTAALRGDAKIGTENLSAEVRGLANALKVRTDRRWTKAQQMEFNQQEQSFVTSRSDAGMFLRFLAGFSEQLNEPFKLSSELEAVLLGAQSLSALKGTLVFDQLESFLVAVESELSSSAEERRIGTEYHRLAFLRDLARLELTRGQWETRQKTNSVRPGESDTADFGILFQPALEFYRLALLRDQALHSNLERLLQDRQAKATIVLAGGFHTDGFKELLKAKGYSYAVVTPRILSLEGEEAYRTVMSGKLSYGKYLKTTFYDAFARHFGAQVAAEENPTEGLRQMKLWRDGIIRHLAEENRLTEAGNYTRYVDMATKAHAEKFDLRRLGKSREEILKEIERELNQFQDATIQSLWSQFHGRLGEFMTGFRGLQDRKELTAENVMRLAGRVDQSRPAALKQMTGVLCPSLSIDSTVGRFLKEGTFPSLLRSELRTEATEVLPKAERAGPTPKMLLEILNEVHGLMEAGDFSTADRIMRDEIKPISSSIQRVYIKDIIEFQNHLVSKRTDPGLDGDAIALLWKTEAGRKHYLETLARDGISTRAMLLHRNAAIGGVDARDFIRSAAFFTQFPRKISSESDLSELFNRVRLLRVPMGFTPSAWLEESKKFRGTVSELLEEILGFYENPESRPAFLEEIKPFQTPGNASIGISFERVPIAPPARAEIRSGRQDLEFDAVIKKKTKLEPWFSKLLAQNNLKAWGEYFEGVAAVVLEKQSKNGAKHPEVDPKRSELRSVTPGQEPAVEFPKFQMNEQGQVMRPIQTILERNRLAGGRMIKKVLVLVNNDSPIPKFGEELIDSYPIVSGVLREFPAAEIQFIGNFPGIYGAHIFRDKGRVRVHGIEYRSWRRQLEATQGGIFFGAVKKYLTEENFDMVFEVSKAPGIFRYYAGSSNLQTVESSLKVPYFFSVLAPTSRMSAWHPIMDGPHALSIFQDGAGELQKVEARKMDSSTGTVMLDRGGIWQHSLNISSDLGFKMDSMADLETIRLDAKEFEEGRRILGLWREKTNGDLKLDPAKKIVLINLYAVTHWDILPIKEWVKLLSALIRQVDNTYFVFTRGGRMDDRERVGFIDIVFSKVKASDLTPKFQAKLNDIIILDRHDEIAPVIHEILGVSDGVISPDTGATHLAAGLYGVPTAVITSFSIFHWLVPRENVVPIVPHWEDFRNTRFLEQILSFVNGLPAKLQAEGETAPGVVGRSELRTAPEPVTVEDPNIIRLRVALGKIRSLKPFAEIKVLAAAQKITTDVATANDRAAVGEEFKKAHDDFRTGVWHDATPENVDETMRLYTRGVDLIVIAAYKKAKEHHPISEKAKVILLKAGSFGVGRMTPKSDLDLSFVTKDPSMNDMAALEGAAKALFYVLLPAFATSPIPVRTAKQIEQDLAKGHDQTKIDQYIRELYTRLLSADYLTGDRAFFVEMSRRFDAYAIRNAKLLIHQLILACNADYLSQTRIKDFFKEGGLGGTRRADWNLWLHKLDAKASRPWTVVDRIQEWLGKTSGKTPAAASADRGIARTLIEKELQRMVFLRSSRNSLGDSRMTEADRAQYVRDSLSLFETNLELMHELWEKVRDPKKDPPELPIFMAARFWHSQKTQAARDASLKSEPIRPVIQIIPDHRLAEIHKRGEAPSRIYELVFTSGQDRLGVLRDLAGTLAANGLDIMAADIRTTEEGVIRDSVWFSVPVAVAEGPEFIQNLENYFRRVFAPENPLSVEDLFAEKEKQLHLKPLAGLWPIPPSVLFETNAAGKQILTVMTQERSLPGFLFRLAGFLTDHGVSVHRAKIAGQSGVIFDEFEITGSDGKPVDPKQSENLVRDLRVYLKAADKSYRLNAKVLSIQKQIENLESLMNVEPPKAAAEAEKYSGEVGASIEKMKEEIQGIRALARSGTDVSVAPISPDEKILYATLQHHYNNKLTSVLMLAQLMADLKETPAVRRKILREMAPVANQSLAAMLAYGEILSDLKSIVPAEDLILPLDKLVAERKSLPRSELRRGAESVTRATGPIRLDRSELRSTVSDELPVPPDWGEVNPGQIYRQDVKVKDPQGIHGRNAAAVETILKEYREFSFVIAYRLPSHEIRYSSAHSFQKMMEAMPADKAAWASNPNVTFFVKMPRAKPTARDKTRVQEALDRIVGALSVNYSGADEIEKMMPAEWVQAEVNPRRVAFKETLVKDSAGIHGRVSGRLAELANQYGNHIEIRVRYEANPEDIRFGNPRFVSSFMFQMRLDKKMPIKKVHVLVWDKNSVGAPSKTATEVAEKMAHLLATIQFSPDPEKLTPLPETVPPPKAQGGTDFIGKEIRAPVVEDVRGFEPPSSSVFGKPIIHSSHSAQIAAVSYAAIPFALFMDELMNDAQKLFSKASGPLRQELLGFLAARKEGKTEPGEVVPDPYGALLDAIQYRANLESVGTDEQIRAESYRYLLEYVHRLLNFGFTPLVKDPKAGEEIKRREAEKQYRAAREILAQQIQKISSLKAAAEEADQRAADFLGVLSAQRERLTREETGLQSRIQQEEYQWAGKLGKHLISQDEFLRQKRELAARLSKEMDAIAVQRRKLDESEVDAKARVELKRTNRNAAGVFELQIITIENDVYQNWFLANKSAIIDRMVAENRSFEQLFFRERLAASMIQRMRMYSMDPTSYLVVSIDDVGHFMDEVFAVGVTGPGNQETVRDLPEEGVGIFCETPISPTEYKAYQKAYGTALKFVVGITRPGVDSGGLLNHLRIVTQSSVNSPVLLLISEDEYKKWMREVRARGVKLETVGFLGKDRQLVANPNKATIRKYGFDQGDNLWRSATRRFVAFLGLDAYQEGIHANVVPGSDLSEILRQSGASSVALKRTEIMTPEMLQAVLYMMRQLRNKFSSRDFNKTPTADAVKQKTLLEMVQSFLRSPYVLEVFSLLKEEMESPFSDKRLVGKPYRIRTWDFRDDKNQEIFDELRRFGMIPKDLSKDPGFELYRQSKFGVLMVVLQLAAIIRAQAERGEKEGPSLEVIFPLIDTVQDVEYMRDTILPMAKAIAAQNLKVENAEALVEAAVTKIKFGIMIETYKAYQNRKELIRHDFVQVCNFGLNDFEAAALSERLGVPVSRDDSHTKRFAGVLDPDYVRAITDVSEEMELYNRLQPAGSPRKSLCFCGEIAAKPKFALFLAHLKANYPNVPFSRSMSPGSISESLFVDWRLQKARPVTESFGELFDRTKVGYSTDGGASAIGDSLVEEFKPIMIPIEGWMQRYERQGRHLAFDRQGVIDVADGMGGMSEFVFLKQMTRALLDNPRDRATLEAMNLSDGDAVNLRDLAILLKFLRDRGIIHSHERKSLMLSYKFLSLAHEVFNQEEGKYPPLLARGHGDLQRFLKDYLEAYRAKYGVYPKWMPVNQVLPEGEKEKRFIQEYKKNSRYTFNMVLRVIHEQYSKRFPPIYKDPEAVETISDAAGRPVANYVIKTREGMTFMTERGFVYDAGTRFLYIEPVGTFIGSMKETDQKVEQLLKERPELVSRTSELAGIHNVRISHNLQARNRGAAVAVVEILQEGNGASKEEVALKRGFQRILALDRNISYVLYRMRNLNLLTGYFRTEIPRLRGVANLENLAESEEPIFFRARGVYEGIRKDPAAVTTLRLTAMMTEVIREKFGLSPTFAQIEDAVGMSLKNAGVAKAVAAQVVVLVNAYFTYFAQDPITDEEIIKLSISAAKAAQSEQNNPFFIEQLYLLAFGNQVAEADFDQLALLRHQGLNAPLAGLDTFYVFAKAIQTGHFKTLPAEQVFEMAHHAVASDRKNVSLAASPDPEKDALQPDPTQSQLLALTQADWDRIVRDYFSEAGIDGNQPVALEVSSVFAGAAGDLLRNGARLDFLLNHYSMIFPSYYRRNIDAETMARQLVFLGHHLRLTKTDSKAALRLGELPLAFYPIPQSFDHGYEIWMSYPRHERGLLLPFVRILFQNQFRIENAVPHILGDGGFVLRILGSFPTEVQDVERQKTQIAKDLRAVFGASLWQDASASIGWRENWESRLLKMNQFYAKPAVIALNEDSAAGQTEIEFSTHRKAIDASTDSVYIRSAGDTHDSSILYIQTTEKKGGLTAILTVLTQEMKLNILDFRFDNIGWALPRIVIYIQKDGRVLNGEEESMIRSRLMDILNRPQIVITNGVISSRSELRVGEGSEHTATGMRQAAQTELREAAERAAPATVPSHPARGELRSIDGWLQRFEDDRFRWTTNQVKEFTDFMARTAVFYEPTFLAISLGLLRRDLKVLNRMLDDISRFDDATGSDLRKRIMARFNLESSEDGETSEDSWSSIITELEMLEKQLQKDVKRLGTVEGSRVSLSDEDASVIHAALLLPMVLYSHCEKTLMDFIRERPNALNDSALVARTLVPVTEHYFGRSLLTDHLSQFFTGEVSGILEPIDVQASVRYLINDIKHQTRIVGKQDVLPFADVDLSIETAPGLSPVILGWRSRFASVISELLKNAVMALPKDPSGARHGRVWIRLEPVKSDVFPVDLQLVIMNEGHPSPDLDPAKIFVPHVSGRKTDETDFMTHLQTGDIGAIGGHGVGLFLSRTIAKLHGGTVEYLPELNQRPDGQPITSFRVTLPLWTGRSELRSEDNVSDTRKRLGIRRSAERSGSTQYRFTLPKETALHLGFKRGQFLYVDIKSGARYATAARKIYGEIVQAMIDKNLTSPQREHVMARLFVNSDWRQGMTKGVALTNSKGDVRLLKHEVPFPPGLDAFLTLTVRSELRGIDRSEVVLTTRGIAVSVGETKDERWEGNQFFMLAKFLRDHGIKPADFKPEKVEGENGKVPVLTIGAARITKPDAKSEKTRGAIELAILEVLTQEPKPSAGAVVAAPVIASPEVAFEKSLRTLQLPQDAVWVQELQRALEAGINVSTVKTTESRTETVYVYAPLLAVLRSHLNDSPTKFLAVIRQMAANIQSQPFKLLFQLAESHFLSDKDGNLPIRISTSLQGDAAYSLAVDNPEGKKFWVDGRTAAKFLDVAFQTEQPVKILIAKEIDGSGQLSEDHEGRIWKEGRKFVYKNGVFEGELGERDMVVVDRNGVWHLIPFPAKELLASEGAKTSQQIALEKLISHIQFNQTNYPRAFISRSELRNSEDEDFGGTSLDLTIDGLKDLLNEGDYSEFQNGLAALGKNLFVEDGMISRIFANVTQLEAGANPALKKAIEGELERLKDSFSARAELRQGRPGFAAMAGIDERTARGILNQTPAEIEAKLTAVGKNHFKQVRAELRQASDRVMEPLRKFATSETLAAEIESAPFAARVQKEFEGLPVTVEMTDRLAESIAFAAVSEPETIIVASGTVDRTKVARFNGVIQTKIDEWNSKNRKFDLGINLPDVARAREVIQEIQQTVRTFAKTLATFVVLHPRTVAIQLEDWKDFEARPRFERIRDNGPAMTLAKIYQDQKRQGASPVFALNESWGMQGLDASVLQNIIQVPVMGLADKELRQLAYRTAILALFLLRDLPESERELIRKSPEAFQAMLLKNGFGDVAATFQLNANGTLTMAVAKFAEYFQAREVVSASA